MARKRNEKLKVRYTTGPVFHALDLPDADDLIVKADLIARIEDIIRDRGLTQVRAAALLGMDQPKVSALLRGRLDRFSIGRLIRALRDLGQDIQVTAISRAREDARGRLTFRSERRTARDAAASRVTVAKRKERRP
jgi:predicted XRE-type DNA-binding protein